ncbi:serine/threonine protein kinase [Hyalangium gracile]|uniref:serine/threonine protein kinase n=1 Tax=Hyalangium gracile TaxID=394092 RepID=UPI001CC9F38A|nr:protein kinase [Hyalangium gracile]
MTLRDTRPHPEMVPGVGIGPWVVRERHDRGSFGLIFRVERAGHPEAGSFALKLALHPDDPRFVREVDLLQRVVHPSVPRFEDRGWWTGEEGLLFPYVVMEWVEGVLLYDWARERPRTSAEVLQLLAQLAEALAVAHAADGLHRDVKGNNVLVTVEGRAVLLDWGCGTYAGAKELTDSVLPPGTSSYRTPEAHRWVWAHRKTGEPYEAGPPDDIYALGVAAYRMCTRMYPPVPEEVSGPQRRVLPPGDLATVSKGLERLVLSALSEERHSRPPAQALAVGFLEAAGDKDASKPIVPTTSAAKTERASKPGPPPEFVIPWWLSASVAAMVGGLVVFAAFKLTSPPQPDPSYFVVEQQRQSPSPEIPDAGVADEVLSSAHDVGRVVMPSYVLGAKMPNTPLPGQRKPPCEPRLQRVINGGCWVPIGTAKPPCGPTAVDYEGGCYMPVYDAPRQPTSGEP